MSLPADEAEFTADFLARAQNLLLAQAPEQWLLSDDDMNQKARLIPADVAIRPAAVLVPIVQRETGLQLLLTKRQASLRKHGGQIAFPGGRMDEGETAEAAALRETAEETGIDQRFITSLGFLDAYLTVTGYLVKPMVGLVEPGFQLAPEPQEVAEVFEVPLRFVMEQKNCQTHIRQWQGMERRYYVYPYQDYYIWGATAGMIRNMRERLYG